MKARTIIGKVTAALGFVGLFGAADSIGMQVLWSAGSLLLMFGGAYLAGINPFREEDDYVGQEH